MPSAVAITDSAAISATDDNESLDARTYSSDQITQKLRDTKLLYDEGILTEQEFADQKDALLKQMAESGTNGSSYSPLSKKIFRIWDIAGASLSFAFWIVSFVLTICLPIMFYDEVNHRYIENYFFELFGYSQVAGKTITAFILLIIQFASIGLYLYFVIMKKGRIKRIVSAAVSLSLAISLIFIDFMLLEFTAIMEIVVASLFAIGLIVSVLMKPNKLTDQPSH